MFDTIDESNFLLIAAKSYNNQSCTDILEFYEDLEKFKHIKKIIKRYKKLKRINIRLYLNHFISLYNVFDGPALTGMICLRFYNDLEYIKPVLELLGFWKETLGPIGMRKEYIKSSEVVSDEFIVSELKKI